MRLSVLWIFTPTVRKNTMVKHAPIILKSNATLENTAGIRVTNTRKLIAKMANSVSSKYG